MRATRRISSRVRLQRRWKIDAEYFAMELRTGTPEEAGMSSRRIQHVRELAARWVEDGTTPSLVILAARRGKVVLHEAYGVLGPESDSPSLATIH